VLKGVRGLADATDLNCGKLIPVVHSRAEWFQILPSNPRRPTRPGLSLASCQLIPTAISAAASHVASGLLCVHAVAITPAGSMELVRQRPSPCNSKVGFCNCFFAACSAFTHVMTRRVAMRPSTSKAPTASLPPLPIRLLPGGANQFPGRELHPLKSSAFHGALLRQLTG
jgi:hypothetical protein